ncbi:MAG: LysR substrate-binding domain-containing protein [Pikeienuella sp.]|uniref:LysR substrate-binding domain-containing protein n=1 Tax=Pikeienuella sp. TaxID=2831957 RepID=UPI00391A3552
MQLHDEVAQGLRAIARIERRAAEIRTGATGGVSIATNGALAVNFLPRLIAGFRGDNSGVGVELRVHSSRQIAAWVAAGQIDIGLIDTPVPVAGLSTEIFRLECVCVMQAKDPLAAEPVVTPAHLRDRSIIGVTGDHAVDRQLETHLSKTGAPVKRDVTSYFFAIGRNIVAEGGGVAIIDPVNGKADLGDGVVWRRFEPRIDHEAAMITARGQILSDAAKAVRQLVRDGLKAVGAETTGVE